MRILNFVSEKKSPKKKCHKKALCTDGMLEKSTGEGRV